MSITMAEQLMLKGRAEGLEEGELKGKLEGERAILLRLGTRRYGKPASVITWRIFSITDATKLEIMGDRIFSANTWEELLSDS